MTLSLSLLTLGLSSRLPDSGSGSLCFPNKDTFFGLVGLYPVDGTNDMLPFKDVGDLSGESRIPNLEEIIMLFRSFTD